MPWDDESDNNTTATAAAAAAQLFATDRVKSVNHIAGHRGGGEGGAAKTPKSTARASPARNDKIITQHYYPGGVWGKDVGGDGCRW